MKNFMFVGDSSDGSLAECSFQHLKSTLIKKVTAVTDYTVVSHKNKLWTIKGTTKVTGADQVMQGGKISKIAGTGTSEITLADGALFPTHEARLETTFTASEAEPKEGEKPATLDFKIIVGGSLAPKPAAAPKSGG